MKVSFLPVFLFVVGAVLFGCADDASSRHLITMSYSPEPGGKVTVTPAVTRANVGDTLVFESSPDETMIITFADGTRIRSVNGQAEVTVEERYFGHYDCEMIVDGKSTVSGYGGAVDPVPGVKKS